jgi:protein transport protein SEC24
MWNFRLIPDNIYSREASHYSGPFSLILSGISDFEFIVPQELLVPLSENRLNIETFLGKLAEMFSNNQSNSSAMGSGLRAGHKLISPLGGKIVVLSASLPNVGHGKLEMREDKKLLGTTKESGLLATANSFYVRSTAHLLASTYP